MSVWDVEDPAEVSAGKLRRRNVDYCIEDFRIFTGYLVVQVFILSVQARLKCGSFPSNLPIKV